MNLLLGSTSTLFEGGYLEYLTDEIIDLFKGIDEIIFIPYARASGRTHDEYTEKVEKFFSGIHIKVRGIHEFKDKKAALNEAKAYYTGGGNTFLLVKQLHEKGLMDVLKQNIESGKPYLGCSAGSNIAGISMKTTNDMPIVFPRSFKCMGLVPFNINPHYLDPHPELRHNGETRETRILEFQMQNDTTVIGLREGNWIRRIGDKITTEGTESTRVFVKNQTPYEIAPGSFLRF